MQNEKSSAEFFVLHVWILDSALKFSFYMALRDPRFSPEFLVLHAWIQDSALIFSFYTRESKIQR